MHLVEHFREVVLPSSVCGLFFLRLFGTLIRFVLPFSVRQKSWSSSASGGSQTKMRTSFLYYVPQFVICPSTCIMS